MTDPTASGYGAPELTNPAPGWYPDATGQQRWWDGFAWTEHVASPAAYSAGAYGSAERPQLPAGTPTSRPWVWVVAVAAIVGSLPTYFFDMSGYIENSMDSAVRGSSSTMTVDMLTFTLVSWGLSTIAYAATVVGAYLDTKQLAAVGVVRPFHWAFAFIPLPLVYLIGRHVVLRKVGSSGGAPLWTHLVLYVVLIVVTIVWSVVVTLDAMTSMLERLPSTLA